MSENFLFCEKYRPKTIDDCVLSDSLKETFKSFISSGQIPNFLFHGPAGCGKTTVARAICREIGADVLFINGSEESGIDVLRTKIMRFASSMSLTGSKKVVILDESDYTNPNSTQPALRAFIEEFSDNCRFIFTCNYKSKIIEPLHSRCSVVDFNISSEDMVKISYSFFSRLQFILGQEGIGYDNVVLADYIKKYFPDYRRVLNEIQRHSTSGTLKISSAAVESSLYEELMGHVKAKKFTDVRSWVAKNAKIPLSDIVRFIYDKYSDKLEPSCVPQLILIMADYMYKESFVADKEINTMAAMVEIMGNISFK